MESISQKGIVENINPLLSAFPCRTDTLKPSPAGIASELPQPPPKKKSVEIAALVSASRLSWFLKTAHRLCSQSNISARKSPEVADSRFSSPEAPVVSRTSPAKVHSSTKEAERLQILSLPKLEPIFFASLETARLEFRSKLESLEIPTLLTISPSYRRAELQLPGVPQVAVKIKKKSINDERILTKLMKEVVGLGHFELPKPQLPFNPFVFANLQTAQNEFFGQISARKLNVVHGKSAKGGRRTLTLPGCPPIIAEGKTKAEHRRALVIGAIKLGVIKLKSAAAPSP
ncbi:hypothetical protein JCM3765_006986 [Sporobolomyces pararoseus]